PLGVLSIVSALLIWQVDRLRSEEARVDRADLVLTRGNALYRLLVDQENGLRGYLLTGRDELLDPYRAARDDVERGLQALAASVAGEPLQAQIVERVREDDAAWQRDGDAAIRARAAGERARSSVPETLVRKDEMDHLRAELQVFLQGEEHLRREREAAARREARATFGLGAAVLGLAAAAIAAGARRRILAIATSYRRAADAESRFRRLWDSNIIGVMYATAGGTITGANDAMLRMIGYSHEDVDAGRVRWTAITPPDQLHLDDEHIAESRE